MALKPCSACGKEVAVNARRCPHCGKNYPVPGAFRTITMALVAVPVLAVLALLGYVVTKTMLLPSPPDATYGGPMAATPAAAPSVSSDTAQQASNDTQQQA